MQILDANWNQHAHLRVTQICYCIEIRNSDISLFLTDHDRNLSFLGETYIADENLSFEAVKFSQNLADDGFHLTSYFSDHILSYDLVETGFLQNAEFLLYQVNWHDSNQYNLFKQGHIGEFKIDDAKYSLTLHGVAKPLENRRGRLLQEKCDAQLGDDRCKIDLLLSQYNSLGAVSEVKDDHSFLVTLPSGIEDGFFERGSVEWQTGANVGNTAFKLKISRHDKQSDILHLIELSRAIKHDIAPTDQLKLVIGCDKNFETCWDKFGNVEQFRGFAHMPGKNFKFAYPQRLVTEFE